jgi:hypothetical protein
VPYTREAQTFFSVDGSKVVYVACPAGGSVTIRNDGNTLYYKSVSSVTSSSNDGNIATGASATFTVGQYVVCAQGLATQVYVYTPDALSVTGEAQSANFLSGTGGPASGPRSVSGTGADNVGVGALYVNETNGATYVNEGTTASPYWTPVSFTQPGLLGLYDDFRTVAGDLVSGSVLAISDTGTVNWTGGGARVCGSGLADTDSGFTQATNVAGSNVGRLTASATAGKNIGLAGPTVAQFKPATNGPMCIDVEFTNVSAITLRTTFCGFVDAFADNAAVVTSGTTLTLTHTNDEITGIYQDVGLTTAAGLYLANEKANAAGTQTLTGTGAGTLPAAATYTRLRVEIRADGSAVGFQDKASIGLIPGASGAGAHTSAIAATTTTALLPLFYVSSTSSAVKSVDVKRFAYWGTRV